jgi:phage-related protein
MSHWQASQEHQYRGQTFTIQFLEDEGHCPAAEFIQKLQTPTASKIDAWLERLAERGITGNDEQCRFIEHDLWELKPFPARLFFFRQGNKLYVTHGCLKKRRRLSKREIDRARRIRDEFLSQGVEERG